MSSWSEGAKSGTFMRYSSKKDITDFVYGTITIAGCVASCGHLERAGLSAASGAQAAPGRARGVGGAACGEPTTGDGGARLRVLEAV